MNPPNIFHYKPAKKIKVGVVLRQNLDQIKGTDIINMFFQILHGEYLLKQKVVAAQTPESNFKANKARNATFEGC